jgi:HEAT repeat protein
MRKPFFALMLVLITALTVADSARAQREGFISVEGGNLKAKLDAAISKGRAGQARFWAAYSFDVRPGVAVDLEFNDGHGNRTIVNGTVYSDGARVETRNLGVFVLYELGGNAIQRVDVFNLDRQHEYSGYRVYWMGRAANEESLNFLKGLVESTQADKVAESAIVALSLHDDPRITGMLEDIARRGNTEKARSTAVFWLGQMPGAHPYLAELARNEQESTKLRKDAVFAIGVGSDPSAIATLQSLYDSVNAYEVKKQIIFAASIHHGEAGKKNDDEGVSFLIKVAESNTDRTFKKDALFWLGQKAGQRSLDALGKTVESRDADTEVQKQAVFAISQRPKDEAVPLLIKIARTHAKPEVRKQAIFWLGQTGDERALEFFKEILSK